VNEEKKVETGHFNTVSIINEQIANCRTKTYIK